MELARTSSHLADILTLIFHEVKEVKKMTGVAENYMYHPIRINWIHHFDSY